MTPLSTASALATSAMVLSRVILDTVATLYATMLGAAMLFTLLARSWANHGPIPAMPATGQWSGLETLLVIVWTACVVYVGLRRAWSWID